MKNLTITWFVLTLMSCSGNQESEQEVLEKNRLDIKTELQLIEETRSNVVLAIKEARYQDISQWVTPDAKTVRPGGPNFDEMFTLGRERGIFPYDSIEMTPIETYIMNDTMAYDWGSSKTYYTDAEGQQIELKNSFLVILKKIDGRWKLHREVASSVLE
ncbi:MAG: nuclear transport factor 2 family protein [Bacteroidota bacterium]